MLSMASKPPARPNFSARTPTPSRNPAAPESSVHIVASVARSPPRASTGKAASKSTNQARPSGTSAGPAAIGSKTPRSWLPKFMRSKDTSSVDHGEKVGMNNATNLNVKTQQKSIPIPKISHRSAIPPPPGPPAPPPPALKSSSKANSRIKPNGAPVSTLKSPAKPASAPVRSNISNFNLTKKGKETSIKNTTNLSRNVNPGNSKTPQQSPSHSSAFQPTPKSSPIPIPLSKSPLGTDGSNIPRLSRSPLTPPPDQPPVFARDGTSETTKSLANRVSTIQVTRPNTKGSKIPVPKFTLFQSVRKVVSDVVQHNQQNEKATTFRPTSSALKDTSKETLKPQQTGAKLDLKGNDIVNIESKTETDANNEKLNALNELNDLIETALLKENNSEKKDKEVEEKVQLNKDLNTKDIPGSTVLTQTELKQTLEIPEKEAKASKSNPELVTLSKEFITISKSHSVGEIRNLDQKALKVDSEEKYQFPNPAIVSGTQGESLATLFERDGLSSVNAANNAPKKEERDMAALIRKWFPEPKRTEPEVPKNLPPTPEKSNSREKELLAIVNGKAKISERFTSRYQLGELLGEGAFGFVFAATRLENNQEVAVKFMIKEKVPRHVWVEDKHLGRVPSEISILKMLDHPNVIKYIEHIMPEEKENDRYIILITELHGTEWDVVNNKKLNGVKNIGLRLKPRGKHAVPTDGISRRAPCDLFECIDAHDFIPEKTAKYIFSQIALAVHYLNQCGVVHRDLKDENIVVDENYHVKIIDFGSAAYIPEKEEDFFNYFNGTMHYASPEICNGESYRGPEAEVWTLGILLYTIMFSENPFQDRDEIVRCTYKFPRKIDDKCGHLIDLLLEWDPDDRVTIDTVISHPWIASEIEGLQNGVRMNSSNEITV